MTVTLEPGLYVPEIGGGIRLENNFLVTQDGPVVLTKYPLDL
jgi:Xaa-Pro dipeptidase